MINSLYEVRNVLTVAKQLGFNEDKAKACAYIYGLLELQNIISGKKKDFWNTEDIEQFLQQKEEIYKIEQGIRGVNNLSEDMSIETLLFAYIKYGKDINGFIQSLNETEQDMQAGIWMHEPDKTTDDYQKDIDIIKKVLEKLGYEELPMTESNRGLVKK